MMSRRSFLGLGAMVPTAAIAKPPAVTVCPLCANDGTKPSLKHTKYLVPFVRLQATDGKGHLVVSDIKEVIQQVFCGKCGVGFEDLSDK